MGRSLLLFLVLLAGTFNAAHAQFSKGQKMAGVSIGSAFFNAGTYDYTYSSATAPFTSRTDAFGFNISPDMGWFFTDKLVLGGRVNVEYRKDKASDEENGVTFRKRTTTDINFTAGIFARYYLEGKNVIPFVQAAFDAGTGTSKTDGFNYTTTYKETYEGKSSGGVLISPSFTIGATKMINKSMGIDLYAGYMYTSHKKDTELRTLRDVDFDGTIDESAMNNPTSKFRNHGFTIGAGWRLFFGK